MSPSPGRRKQKVDSLLQSALSRILIDEVQDLTTDLVTVTRVETSSDLQSARVYLSLFGTADKEPVLAHLRKRTGFLRRRLAGVVELKYNSMLFFELDPAPEFSERLDRLLEKTNRHDPDSD